MCNDVTKMMRVQNIIFAWWSMLATAACCMRTIFAQPLLFALRLAFLFYMLFFAIQFCTQLTFQSGIIEMERWSAHSYIFIYINIVACTIVHLRYSLDSVCYNIYSMEQQTILWAKPCVAHTKNFVFRFDFGFLLLFIVHCMPLDLTDVLELVSVCARFSLERNTSQSSSECSSQLSCYVHSIDRIKSESFPYAFSAAAAAAGAGFFRLT